MVKTRELSPLPLLDEAHVLAVCAREGIKPHNAYKMWRGLIKEGHTSVRDIPGLPKALYEVAEREFALTTSTVVKSSASKDGSTTKLLVKLQDGNMVESVIMRYGMVQFSSYLDDKGLPEAEDPTFKSKPRATLCISSQIGCSMGCTFCATGTMGLIGHLTAGEILEQLYHANKIAPIQNVVFMGMGEPLDNYTATLAAIRGMTDVQRWSMKYTSVSVSTVGVVPRLMQLARDAPKVNLALSLHAPNQALRMELVPSAKAWHIDKIMEALDEFIYRQNLEQARIRTVLIEYVLIAGVNDAEETAHELGKLLQDRAIMLNVIPYNPTEVPHDYKSPTVESTHRFNSIVREYGVKTMQRQELGQDIASACGQLVVSTLGPAVVGAGTGGGGCTSNEPADLEDVVPAPAPASSSSAKPRQRGKAGRAKAEAQAKKGGASGNKAEGGEAKVLAEEGVATKFSPMWMGLLLAVIGLLVLMAERLR